MPTLTEGMHEGEFIGEMAMDIGFHVDEVTVLDGQNLVAGAVIGDVLSGTSQSAAKSGGNTGDGTFVLDATTPIQPGAKEGVYTLRCIEAVTNGGVFRLEDPDGIVLGDVTIPAGAGNSVTVNEHIKGVLTDGDTDFAAGDGFDITLSAIIGKVVEYNPAGTDGSQHVGGILMKNTDASAADVVSTAVRRGPITVNGNDLTWKSGMTDAQKTAAKKVLLEKRGIKVSS